jgi:hypothetical protein
MKGLLLLILFCQSAFAQPSGNDTLQNFTDPATGFKQGHWVILNKVKKLPDYPAEAKVEEGKFVDSKKDGIWKMYFANGTVKSEITYTNNRPSGYAKIYYPNGKLQEEGNWENNRWVGGYKTYYENGQAFYDFNYTNVGKREGEQKYYYENGQIMMIGAMHEGKEAGVWEEHYENGDLRAKKIFNDGALDVANTEVFAPKQPLPIKKEDPTKEPAKIADIQIEKTNAAQKPFDGNGYAKLFLPGARISKDGEFKNFRLIDGKDYVYNTDGLLNKIAIYKGGKYVGDAPIEEKDK